MKLTPRLQKIADEIKPGETMADIGTDHGFLPLFLWEQGISPQVIMADISKGSLDKAAENCRRAAISADCAFGCTITASVSRMSSSSARASLSVRC